MSYAALTAYLDSKSLFLLGAVQQCRYPAELARYLLLPKPTVSFMIKRLEALKYVTRQSVEQDLRKYEIKLTLKGENVFLAGSKIVEEKLKKVINKLSDDEKKLYYKLMLKLNPQV